MSASEGFSSMRSLSEISEEGILRFSVDLVAASRRNLGFLRLVFDSHWLHQKSTVLEAIRRYDELWMPLIADLTTGSKPPMILPPLDVEWVWYCHTLNPANYKHYCESRFSKLIGKPAIFDEENEEYALNRCREIWESNFPSEPFENESDTNFEHHSSVISEDLLDQVSKQRNLYRRFSEPYYSEMVYLVAAKQRYKGFIYMVHRFADECSCFVPTSDVLLMWLTHQSYPTVYAVDVKELEGDVEKIVGLCETVKDEDIQETKMLWERTFDQPYEKAGGSAIAGNIADETPFHWDVTNTDVNTRYKSLVPRFLFEFSTRERIIFLERVITRTSLTSGKEVGERVRIVADNSTGTSIVLVEMRARPGDRRLGRDDIGRNSENESVPSTRRVGGGFWRRGGEAPKAVKWEERIIEICEGSWSYVIGSSSIGRSPGTYVDTLPFSLEILPSNFYCYRSHVPSSAVKVVGTATPKEPTEGYQASWSFSTGNDLLIQWDSSTSISGLRFDLQNNASSESMVKNSGIDTKGKEKINDEENEFVTIIRYSDENPTGKATALLNWKLLVVELLPEEDAILVLLVCLSILRSVSEMKREDVGNLLVRRRIREATIGERDWGSVILHPSSYCRSISSTYLQPWYWNAKLVMASQVKDQVVTPPSPNYSQAEGGDKLYKSGIIP
ncbi:hypothetical protein DH2020_024243 [Rehmannia glutinosa]|uniref:GRPD C-terminal domain-containing protein n=1 Tax=Rehmannia glutinosa TaxID=99300 RepID=A0ABR0WCP6_REHGL